MLPITRLPAAAFAVLAVLLVAPAAFAASISAAPIVDFVMPILTTIIGATIAVGLPIVLTSVTKRLGLQIEASKRDALQVALTNAAGGLVAKLGDQARDLKIDVKNPAMADAVARVVRGAPDALKWAGLTEAEIARRVLEKIPQLPTSIALPLGK